MARRAKTQPPANVTQEELAAAVSADTAAIELEKLQKKIAREERKKRREIEAAKQKKATWVLPTILLVTMTISWILSRLNFQVGTPTDAVDHSTEDAPSFITGNQNESANKNPTVD